MPLPVPSIDAAEASRFARLALDCVQREYPNYLHHLLQGAADVRCPRQLTPAFYGCFDWHSAVHGHWTLVRLLRLFPEADWSSEARLKLDASLTDDNIAGELAYIAAPGREGFERPYGLAWLLQLAAELREWEDPRAFRWSQTLEPLEQLAAGRLAKWLPRLTGPIRSGEHSQTAFAMGLALDWSRSTGDAAFEQLLVPRALDFHGGDDDAPLPFEPSAYDFLSPTLAAADLLRRVLPAGEFAAWLTRLLPDLPADLRTEWLLPVTCSDPSDGKLSHLDGLNLSRAWMLQGIAAGLPAGDTRIDLLLATAERHRNAGLPAVTGEHYAGGHWLGTFATYLETGRGLSG